MVALMSLPDEKPMQIANILIPVAMLWPTCATIDPCAPNSPLQVDEDVKEACEGSGETGGDDDLGQGDLALIYPMPTWQAPDYGFLDINNPPAGHTYDEIALEEQRFAYSCAGAAPGVNNCAIGITGAETEFTRTLGIAMCPNWIGTWGMPEVDPGWLDDIPGSPMTTPLCEALQGPEDAPEIICKAITCLGEINGQEQSRSNYWEDCTCNCTQDSDCPSPGELEMACEMGLCLAPNAAPPAPAGGPTVYGLADWSTDLQCSSGSCTLSRRLVYRIGHSAALTWDDFDFSLSPTGGNVTLTAVGSDSLPDAIGLEVGDVISEGNLRGVLAALLSGRPATLSVMRGTASVVISLDVL